MASKFQLGFRSLVAANRNLSGSADNQKRSQKEQKELVMLVSSRFPKARVAPLAAIAAAVGTLGLASAVSASEIGIQFVGTGTALASTVSAGAPGVAQVNWNPLTGDTWTSQALNDSTGATSGVTLTGEAPYTWHGGEVSDTPGDITLTSGQIAGGFAGPGSNDLTFSGITYRTYSVYAYAVTASGRDETIAVTPNGGSVSYQSFATSPGGSAWVLANNPVEGWTSITQTTPPLPPAATYAVFTGLTASSFTLGFGAQPENGAIAGIQIVDTSAPVPEPATLGLMGLGGLGILLLGRRRKIA